MTLDQAREVLRIDGTDNDEIIQELLNALPSYLSLATGLNELEQLMEPLCFTVSSFILKLWYNAEQSEAEKLQRVIDSLLKSITLKRTK